MAIQMKINLWIKFYCVVTTASCILLSTVIANDRCDKFLHRNLKGTSIRRIYMNAQWPQW